MRGIHLALWCQKRLSSASWHMPLTFPSSSLCYLRLGIYSSLFCRISRERKGRRKIHVYLFTILLGASQVAKTKVLRNEYPYRWKNNDLFVISGQLETDYIVENIISPRLPFYSLLIWIGLWPKYKHHLVIRSFLTSRMVRRLITSGIRKFVWPSICIRLQNLGYEESD
jgi:hypothetical protein